MEFWKGEAVLEEEKARNNYWKIINKFIVSSEKAHMLPYFCTFAQIARDSLFIESK